MPKCDDCANPLNATEFYYYERRCEACERNWTDRMMGWMRGQIIDQELDAFYSGLRKRIR